MKLISKSVNGQIAFCPCQNIFHVEFGNLLLNLSYEDLKRFSDYVRNIDYAHYLRLNKDSFNRRKLLLNISASKACLCLSSSEFLELRELLELKNHPRLLNNSDLINWELVLN